VRALLRCWNEAVETPAASLATALSGDGALARLRDLLCRAAPDGHTTEALLDRLAFFLSEDARVPLAAEAFAARDAATLGRLAADSQREADQWLGNQVPETRALAAAALDRGALAATSFGAGFGGSVWALVPASDAPAFAVAWLTEYARRCPSATNVEWFAARPGPALTEVPL
jgi:galactokinase